MSEQDLPALRGFVESAEVVEPIQSTVGEYTLERIPPERVERIARYLAGGVPIVRICRELGASPSTVYAVKRLRPEAVEREKERLGRRMWFLSDLAAGALEEKIAAGECPANVLSFTMGLAADKGLALMGQATAIVEHKKGPSAEEVRSLADMLRERAAKVIEVSAEVRAPDYGAGADANKDGVSGDSDGVCAGGCAGEGAQDGGQGAVKDRGAVDGGGGGSSFQKSAGERMHSNEAGRRDNAREDVEP